MMNSKKMISLCLVVAMLMSLLAGCKTAAPSDSQDPGGASVEPTADNLTGQQGENVQQHTAVGGEVVDASKTAAEIVTEQRSVINYGMAVDCIDFDPFTYNTGGMQTLVGLYQPLAHTVDGECIGVILKDYSYSEDGMTMYGEIYDYVTDSDGNNITASDVVFSFEMSNELAGLGLNGLVDTFTATGDYTFEVAFTRVPGVGQFDKLVKFFIVSEKAYEEHNMHEDPIGTGPYAMTEHVSGYSTTYQKRDNYWQTDASLINPRDMANVDTINFYVISEASQRTIAMQNGTIDCCMEISAEDLQYFADSDDFWISAIPDDLSLVVYPNCDPSRPTGDLNLRLAIFYAISSEAVLESVYGGRGTVQHSKAPSWAYGYVPEWDEATDDFYTFDLEKAKQYLDQSSYKGETLVILCTNETKQTDTAQILASMLEQIGIKTVIDALDGTIVKKAYADVTAWDLYLQSAATNVYWIDAINGALTTDKTTWDGSENFWYEQELQDMLLKCMQVENATPENFTELHNYIIDNALLYGIVNSLSYTVMPDWCTGVCLSYKKCLMPGGCTYLAG